MLKYTAKSPLLEMEPGKALWHLAWPVLTLGLLRSVMFLADSAWVGTLGADALSGQAGASFAAWIMHGWGDFAAVGLLALVARAVGAGSPDRVRSLYTQGLWLGAVLGAVLVASSTAIPPLYFEFLGFVGSDFGPSLTAGTEYLEMLMIGGPTLTLFLIIHATYRALGDTKTPLAISAVALVANIALDPVFMFGIGPFPEMGVSGAALATVVSDGLGTVIGFIVLFKRGLRPRLARPSLRLSLSIARISAPMAIASIGFCLVYVFLGPIMTDFGPQPMAALGVGHRIESVAFFLCVGVGTATATLVGQNLGASRADAAEVVVGLAERVLVKGLLPLTALFLVTAPTIFSWFTEDPYFVSAGSSYLRAASLVFVFMGWEFLYEHAYTGAGLTLPPTLVSLPLTAARIPLAWAFVEWTTLGLDGVWVAIAVTTLAKGVCLRTMFRRGTWKKKTGLEV